MVNMIIYYWDWILVIAVVSVVSSFISSKLGIVLSSLMTGCLILFTVLVGAAGAGGADDFMLLGFVLFPALSWVGFIAGRALRKRRLSKSEKPI